MTIHLLQQEPARHRTYRSITPFLKIEDPALVAVVDPGLITQIFRSEKFRVVDYAGACRRISAQTGIDLSGLVTALDHIPLAQEGELHAALRAEMAQLLAARARTIEKLREPIEMIVGAALRPGAEVDLVSDLAVPVYDAVFAHLVDVGNERFSADSSVSLVFDGMMSLNRRKRLDAVLKAMLARFAAFGPDLGPRPEIALALNILGQDALVGTLTLSLWRDLSVDQGLTLDKVAFSPTPSATAVAYIDRVATEDVDLGTLRVAKGEVARLYLDAATIEALGEDGGVLFGKGRHLCLGRPLALSVWTMFTQAISKSSLAFSLGDFELRKGDHVFIYPSRAVLDLGR